MWGSTGKEAKRGGGVGGPGGRGDFRRDHGSGLEVKGGLFGGKAENVQKKKSPP